MTKRSLLPSLLVAITLVFQSCQSNDNGNENPIPSIEEKQDISEKDTSEKDVSAPSVSAKADGMYADLEDPELFQHYYGICQSEAWPEWVDGAKIIQAYDKYPDPQYDRAFEWDVLGASTCSDSLIVLSLQSFTEGLIVDYHVAINDKGIITDSNAFQKD